MTNEKPSYQDLEQRISLLEQELHDKIDRLSVLSSSFDEIQKLARTGHWELDFVNNKLYWSDEIFRIFESSSHEFEATYEAFLSFIHPEDRDYVNSSYQNHLISKAPYNITHRILLKDGSIKFVNERCKSDFDSNGKPIRSLGTVADVTDQIQIKNELKLAREKNLEKERNIQEITSNFETFFNTIDDFLFVIDEQGIILHCNKTVEKRLDYTTDELKGASILNVHPKERKNETIQILNDVLIGRLASFQIPLVTKQGNQIHVETHVNYGIWNGKQALYGVSKDITKLKFSEEKFSTAFYLNPSACGLSDASTGAYTEVNDAFCNLFGYSREEAIGRTAIELQIMTAKTRDEVLSKANKLGCIYNAEAKLSTKQGDFKSVLLSGQNINIQDVTYRYTVVHDVTEIHKAKEIAEENEQKFSMLLNACPEPLSVTTIEDGRFIITNEAFHKAFGSEREDILNQKSLELNAWLRIEDRQKWLDELVKNGSVRSAEFQLQTKKYGIRDYLISSDIIELDKKKCAINFYIDITDIKNTEIELLKAKEKVEESEEKFKNLYDSLSISYLTLKDGVCIECNEATMTIYGVNSKDEIIGKSPIDYSPEFQSNNQRSSEEAKRHNQTAIEEGFHTFEWLAQRKDKKEFYAEVSLKKYYYKNELYIQCLTTDITERKRIENELIAAKDKAEEREKYLSVIYESSGLSIFVVNVLEDGSFRYEGVNPMHETLMNIKNSEIVGKTPEEMAYHFGKETIHYVNTIYTECVQKRTTSITEFHIQQGLAKGWWLSRLTPLMDKKTGRVTKLIGGSVDITERKKAELELLKAKEKAEESESKFKNLYESLSISYLILKDGVYIECNEATLPIFGIDSKNEIIGKVPDDFSPEFQPNHVKSSEEAELHIQTAIEKGVHTFEWITIRKNKQEFYSEVSLKRFYYKNELYIQCLIADISERKKIEAELITAKEHAEDNEKLLTDLINNSSSFIYLLDTQGKFLTVNNSLATFFNKPVNEIIGCTRDGLLPKEIAKQHLNNDRLVIAAQKTISFEETSIHPDGVHYYFGQKFPLIDNSGKLYGVGGISTDVTELKKIQNDLSIAKKQAVENELFLHTLINNLPDLVWLKDVTGVYLTCNKRFEDFIGAPAHEIIGKTDYDFISADMADFFRQKDMIAINAGKSMINEEFITFASDQHSEYIETIKTPFYQNGELVGVIGIGRNITERKNAEFELLKAKEKVEESEAKFKNLYESLSIAYLIIKDGICVECNKAALDIYCIESKDEIIGKSPIDYSPDYQYNNIKSTEEAQRQTRIALEKGFHTFEWLAMRKNKELFYNEVSLKKFYYKNELYLQCLTTDITERKRIENELIAAKEKDEESDRLKTAFLHNMSHEIRTPLNAISGFSELLEEPDLQQETKKSYFQIIQNNTHQLISIVNDILTISSLETKQVKSNISTVCVNDVIDELLTVFMQQSSKRNVILKANPQLDDQQSEIETDKTKITQVLSNLLSNALKFTHEGSIEFGYNMKGNELEFFVKDSGIGIKQEFHDKIFERFRQADKSINEIYGGTGLGLAISKAFVELLGGKIWVQSEFGKGSTFYFTVPYKPAIHMNS